MTTEITNTDNVIDSRDIIERIKELEEMRDDSDDSNPFDDDLKNELEALNKLAQQCEGYGDWEYGETLISREYWVEYVEELIKDIGDLPRDIPHYIVIDWEATAENIEVDYMTVDFDGEEYLMRSC